MIALAVAAAACSAPRGAHERFEFSRLSMGVEARIVLFAPDRVSAEHAVDAAFESIAALDDVLSDWKPDSELSRLMSRAADAPVVVSDDLFDVLRLSIDISRRTDGAFDPTIGPLVAIWRAMRASNHLPGDNEFFDAAERMGIEKIELDENARSVHLARPGMRLDFGAIGKGFACQRALEVLAAKKIASALVQMGGDLMCSAAPPGSPGWRIDLEADGESLIVSNCAVSISGDREQWVESGNQRFSHVINPRSGLGLQSRARAIVVGPEGATADALATAITVRGSAAGLSLATRFSGVEARLEEGLGGRRWVRSTPGFARFVEKNPDPR